MKEGEFELSFLLEVAHWPLLSALNYAVCSNTAMVDWIGYLCRELSSKSPMQVIRWIGKYG